MADIVAQCTPGSQPVLGIHPGSLHDPLKPVLTLPLRALCAALAAAAPAHADVRANIGLVFDNRYHHDHHDHRDHYYPASGDVAPYLPRGAIVVGTGPGRYWFHTGVWYQPYSPRYRVVLPPVGAVIPLPPPPQPPKAEPIIYPRNGQSPEQLENDRRDGNRWATTQPNAQPDASVFDRAVDACMDGRGYTMK